MTLAHWFQVFAAFVCTVGLGFLSLLPFRLKGSWIHNWASYYLTGQLIIFILVLSTAFCPWGIPDIKIAVITLLAGAWAIRSLSARHVAGGRVLAVAILTVLISAVAFPDVVLVAHQVPLLEWDARSSWFFHGKALFLAGHVDASYFTNTLYSFSRLDYPLFVGAQAAWTAQFVGQWDDYSSKAFLLFNFAAYMYLVWLILSRRGSNRWLVLLFIAVLFDQETYSYVSGLADNHYIIALVIILMAVGAGGWPSELAFVALMLAFAANIKNESRTYVIIFLGACAIVWVWHTVRNMRLNASHMGKSLHDSVAAFTDSGIIRSGALAAIAGLAPILMWQIFRAQHGVINPFPLVEQLAAGKGMIALAIERIPLIWGYMAEYCHFQHLDYLTGLLLLLMLLRITAHSRTARPEFAVGMHEIIVWIALVVVCLATLTAYMTTALDCEFHLRTSAGRLLLLPRLLIYVLVFYAAEPLCRKTEGMTGQGRSA